MNYTKIEKLLPLLTTDTDIFILPYKALKGLKTNSESFIFAVNLPFASKHHAYYLSSSKVLLQIIE